MTRKGFLAASAAFAMGGPRLVAATTVGDRALKTPLMLDTSLYAPPAALDALLPVTDMWLPDYKADDDALHVKYTGVSNKVVRKNLERLVAAKAKMEVRCLAVPGCTDGDDLTARHRYLHSIGIPESAIVNLEYYDYARSKYLALGLKDTMPPKGGTP